jgi:lauroyl/myristoyl acyltransferase
MMRLHEIMLANACVFIAGEHAGRRNVVAPFLGREQAFATGAWSLARSTGAALLIGQSHRVASGAYRVVIEPVAIAPGLSPWERRSTIDPATD